MIAPTLASVLQLNVAERIQLVEDIWGSIVAMPETLPVTEAQRQELNCGCFENDSFGSFKTIVFKPIP